MLLLYYSFVPNDNVPEGNVFFNCSSKQLVDENVWKIDNELY